MIICDESGRLMVVFRKPFSGPKHEQDASIRRTVETWTIKVRDAKRLLQLDRTFSVSRELKALFGT